MTLKIEVINGAYSRIRISGLTVQATPNDTALALDRLEDLAEELSASNICIGYNFENEPDANSETNVKRKFKSLLETNLAVRLLSDFGKEIPQSLGLLASGTLSSAASITASQRIREVQPPRRMPRGSGNRDRYRHYQVPVELPPNECATNIIKIGEISDFTEDFETYLSGETLSSYTIAADAGLSVESDSNDDPLISYRIKALANIEGVWQQVKITITTDTGRIEIRTINFEVQSVPTVS